MFFRTGIRYLVYRKKRETVARPAAEFGLLVLTDGLSSFARPFGFAQGKLAEAAVLT
jgi:hypothetical protein